MQTFFEYIIENHSKPIQSIPDTPIQFLKLANGIWGYLIIDLDGDYQIYHDFETANNKWRKYLKSLLDQDHDDFTPWRK